MQHDACPTSVRRGSRRSRRDVGAAASVVLVLLLAGCAAAGPDEAPASEAAGTFVGPWAAEFERFSEDATSDFERGALADSVVSDQEYSEMTERFRSCLESAGLTFSGFGADGSYTATPTATMDPDVTQRKTASCSSDAGEESIGALHTWAARNPDGVDEATLMVDCMVGAGLVDESYTAEDWTRENAASSLPASVSSDQAGAYESCVADPLGLLGG